MSSHEPQHPGEAPRIILLPVALLVAWLLYMVLTTPGMGLARWIMAPLLAFIVVFAGYHALRE